MEFIPLHFLDQPIEPVFDTPPAREKTPDCPNGFIWEGKTYRVVGMLSSWSDFKRRGRMAQNMRPAHAAVASTRGSLNVGRFYFRVRALVLPAVELRGEGSVAEQSGSVHPAVELLDEQERVFDIYYDRAMKNVDDRKGQWFVYRELGEG